MNKNTSNDKAVEQTTSTEKSAPKKVVSDDRENGIREAFKLLHHHISCQIVDQGGSATFPTDFAKCGLKDYSTIAVIAGGMLKDKSAERRNLRLAAVKPALQSVINTHMALAQEDYVAWGALPERVRARTPFATHIEVPMSEVRACWKEGTSDQTLLSDITALGFQVSGNMTEGTVKVPFAPTKEEKVAKVA